jgi:DNA-binding NtrC family response regulator
MSASSRTPSSEPSSSRETRSRPTAYRRRSWDARLPRGAGGLYLKVGASLEENERRLILATLEHVSGSKRKAAELLGISLKTLYTRLSSYQVRSDPRADKTPESARNPVRRTS